MVGNNGFSSNVDQNYKQGEISLNGISYRLTIVALKADVFFKRQVFQAQFQDLIIITVRP